MAAAFARHDVDVTWLFSGRPQEQLFDMAPFGDYSHRQGLTFATKAGRVRIGSTLRNNSIINFRRDVNTLDLTPFDLIVTDYEPVVAWAARRALRPAIGIGHQYAFGKHTPVSGANLISKTIMERFAPVTRPLGLHWHPYADNVLPPILDLPPMSLQRQGHVLVYLPFEDQASVTQLLQQLPQQRFIQYASGLQAGVHNNVELKPSAVASFKRDLASSNGVICNTGFELISECLHWGKPILSRPLAGQMEQLSNALALEQLNYAHIVHDLSAAAIDCWLQTSGDLPTLQFPDVAAVLAQWLVEGCRTRPQELASALWREQGAQPDYSHCTPLNDAA